MELPVSVEKFTKGNVTIELIKLAPKSYCVSKVTKRLLFGDKKEFYVLDRVGTEFTYEGLSETATIGDIERCYFIYHVNYVKLGGSLK